MASSEVYVCWSAEHAVTFWVRPRPGLSRIARNPVWSTFHPFPAAFQAGQHHHPAAVWLRIGILAQLIVGDAQAAGFSDGLDFPGNVGSAFGFDLLAPQRLETLHQTTRRVDFKVFAFEDRRASPGRRIAKAGRPV